MKTAIQGILAIVILLLGYALYESIMEPIRFNQERDIRYTATIERLKDIRTCQNAYKSENARFTGDFDTLVNFIKTGNFKIIKQIGSKDDSLAVALGKVRREEVLVPILDSLYGSRTDFNIEDIKYVPFTNKKNTFEMGSTILLTGSNVRVPVFECKVHNDVLLNGLDRQLIINFNAERTSIEKYPGVMVGSLKESNNGAGNWE